MKPLGGPGPPLLVTEEKPCLQVPGKPGLLTHFPPNTFRQETVAERSDTVKPQKRSPRVVLKEFFFFKIEFRTIYLPYTHGPRPTHTLTDAHTCVLTHINTAQTHTHTTDTHVLRPRSP